jgi:amino acid transporter
MTKPKQQFPVAMLVASVVIILLFTLGSFAVATVLPDQQINLQAGLMKAFQQIFARFGIAWATPVACLLLAFGGIGGVMSWMSGPSRGLLWTAQEGEIPPFLAKTNKNGVQISILIVQGVIVTVLAMAYFVMSDVSVAFFLLSAMTITLYLIMYMLMYAAAIRLRYSQPDLKRSYRVPGGTGGMWGIAGVGFVGVVFAFIVGFFPPSQLPVGSPALYVGLVVAGTVIFTGLPLLIGMLKQASWRAVAPPAMKAT